MTVKRVNFSPMLYTDESESYVDFKSKKIHLGKGRVSEVRRRKRWQDLKTSTSIKASFM